MKIKVFLMAVGILLSLSALANDLVVNENHSESSVELQDSVSKERFFSVKLGYGIGGTMPFPLPAEMRSINGFKPLCNLSLHGVYHILFDKKVGMKVGVGIDRKGMVADATVKNYSMSITDDAGGVVSGRWTGDVQMKAVQTALTIPVAVEWYPSDRWDVNFGPYFSHFFVNSPIDSHSQSPLKTSHIFRKIKSLRIFTNFYFRSGWISLSQISITNFT